MVNRAEQIQCGAKIIAGVAMVTFYAFEVAVNALKLLKA